MDWLKRHRYLFGFALTVIIGVFSTSLQGFKQPVNLKSIGGEPPAGWSRTSKPFHAASPSLVRNAKCLPSTVDRQSKIQMLWTKTFETRAEFASKNIHGISFLNESRDALRVFKELTTYSSRSESLKKRYQRPVLLPTGCKRVGCALTSLFGKQAFDLELNVYALQAGF